MEDHEEYVRPRCIIALIGPLGSGKRTLAAKVADLYAASHADQLTLFPLSTTRVVGTRPNDVLFFRHLHPLHFGALALAGRIVDAMEHLGERYGYNRNQLDETLERKDIISPMRAQAVVALRQLGYVVHVVRVIAKDRYGEARMECDRDPLVRACSLRADMTLINVFDDNGLKMSVNHLAYLVTMWTGYEHPVPKGIPLL